MCANRNEILRFRFAPLRMTARGNDSAWYKHPFMILSTHVKNTDKNLKFCGIQHTPDSAKHLVGYIFKSRG